MTVVDPATIAKLSDDNKKIVLDHIRSKCVEDSNIEDLRDIAKFLAADDSENNKLEIKILSGGLANFSYQIYTSDGSHKLYAKLTFPFMQLFPDIPSPTTRTENEFKMMTMFEDIAPGCVAKPYYCDDVDGGSKLLIAQWSKSDEQFGNQFIDGIVDIRLANKLGTAIASLHSSEFDPEFNSGVRPLFHSFTDILMGIIDGLYVLNEDDAKPKDRVSAHAIEYTYEKLMVIFESYKDTLTNRKDVLTHGDFHVFNIMCEKKPSIMTLENFGPDGSVAVCDFELSAASFPGRDLGPFMGFPISCALAHTLNDNTNMTQDILTFIDSMWDNYFSTMKEKGGKTDVELAQIYREHMIFCGLYMLAYYGLDVHMNYLPFDEGDVENRTKTKESIGMIGLKCFILGNTTEPVMTLDELKSTHKSWLDEEMTLLSAATKKRPSAGRGRRRSSMLRQTGRRVSDGHLHLQGMDRESFTKMRESFRGLEELADIDIGGDI